MPRWKRILRTLRQSVVILLITIALAEISFRIYARINPTFIFYGNSYNRYRAKPHSYDYDFQINSRGFKDVEFSSQKQEGTFRVLGLGDSFAYGIVPYQYNYLTVLENGLNDAGRRVELINMGIGGTGPRDYLSVLVKEGLELRPDMVLVSFFVGNDFTDPSVEKSEKNLYSYSYVATFAKYLVDIGTKYNERPLQATPAEFDQYNDDAPTFVDDYFLKLEIGRSEIYKKQSEQFSSQFAEAVSYLKQIKGICDANKVRLAVVVIPDEVQVNKDLQFRVMQIKTFSFSPDDFDFTLPNRMLTAALKDLDIECVELLDRFKEAGAKTILYKPLDTHWNIAGNQLAADIIQKDLFPDSANTVINKGPRASAEATNYEGFHETADCKSIKGWLWNARRPNESMRLELYDGNSLIATVPADLFRKDLLDAGKGNGAHGFEFVIPPTLKDGRPHQIRAIVADTGIELIGTPKSLQCPIK